MSLCWHMLKCCFWFGCFFAVAQHTVWYPHTLFSIRKAVRRKPVNGTPWNSITDSLPVNCDQCVKWASERQCHKYLCLSWYNLPMPAFLMVFEALNLFTQPDNTGTLYSRTKCVAPFWLLLPRRKIWICIVHIHIFSRISGLQSTVRNDNNWTNDSLLN